MEINFSQEFLSFVGQNDGERGFVIVNQAVDLDEANHFIALLRVQNRFQN